MTSWADIVDVEDDIFRLENDIPLSPILPFRQFATNDPSDDLKRAEVREWINSFSEPRTFWHEIIIASKNRFDDQYNSLGINTSSQNRRQNLFGWTHIYYSKKSTC